MIKPLTAMQLEYRAKEVLLNAFWYLHGGYSSPIRKPDSDDISAANIIWECYVAMIQGKANK